VVRSVNRAGTGSALITVHGRGIGTHAHSAGGRIGHTGCELTLWDSDTSVRCHVGQGATGTRRAVATVGERKGSMSHGWSVDAARLSALRRANHRGTGSASVTLHGMGLGLAGGTAKSRVGNSMCEATGWESETSLRCLAGGVGGTKRAVLSVGQRTGSVSRAWSVDAAAVSVIRGGNKAGTGSAWVTVHGAGLGLESSTGKVRMGHTGCQASVWQSDTALTCRMAHGAMGTRRVAMTAGGRGGSVSHMLSFDLSILSSIKNVNRGTGGSFSITVHGADIGIVILTRKLRVGITMCEATKWLSETTTSCRVGSGIKQSIQAILTSGSQVGSFSDLWTFDAAGMSALMRFNVPATGSSGKDRPRASTRIGFHSQQ
jgi:hypothetical protein